MRWVSAACVVRSKAEPIPLPQPDGEPKEYSDKIRKLVEGIASLTLSETAQLSELLKVRANTISVIMHKRTSARLQHNGGVLHNSTIP